MSFWGDSEEDASEPTVSVTATDDSPSHFIHKGHEVRIVVMVTCGLSMLGSLFIILSYVLFRTLRSRARQILLHISVMDFGVAAANLIGAAAYFDQFFSRPDCLGTDIHAHPRICPVNPTIKNLCTAQAFFAAYFTYGSVLWTIALSLYLYFLIVHHGTKRAKYILLFSYFFCYLMPALLSLWLVFTGRLGYAPYNSGGWCTLILKDPWTGKPNVYVTVIGYDLWIYLAFILVPVLSITVHLYIRQELQKSKTVYGSDRFWLALQTVDYKFLLIPVVFIILRIWTCIINALFVYKGVHHHMKKELALTLMNLSGIGDSGQGMVNAILFVIFTKTVRTKFLNTLYSSCCKRKKDGRETGERQQLLSHTPPLSRENTRHTSPSMERTPSPPE